MAAAAGRSLSPTIPCHRRRRRAAQPRRESGEVTWRAAALRVLQPTAPHGAASAGPSGTGSKIDCAHIFQQRVPSLGFSAEACGAPWKPCPQSCRGPLTACRTTSRHKGSVSNCQLSCIVQPRATQAQLRLHGHRCARTTVLWHLLCRGASSNPNASPPDRHALTWNLSVLVAVCASLWHKQSTTGPALYGIIYLKNVDDPPSNFILR